MSKQAEIREGIQQEICCLCVHKPTHKRASWGSDKTIQIYGTGCSYDYEKNSGQFCELVIKVADAVLRKEDSQGVVLKVDRELPQLDVAWEDGVSFKVPYEYAQKEMVDSGWGTFESLIGYAEPTFNNSAKE